MFLVCAWLVLAAVESLGQFQSMSLVCHLNILQ